MGMYKEWLEEERKWIGSYSRRTLRRTFLITVPLTVIFMALLFGGLSAVDGGGAETFLEGAVGGAMLGLFFGLIYLLILWIGLRPGKFKRLIQKSVRELGLTESEQELLGGEMLKALKDPSKVVTFEMVGPNSNHTPARFVLTPHYAFLEGGSPYSILVRLSDIAQIRPREEEKTAVTRSAKTRTRYHFTLYSIGFYRKDRQLRGVSDEELPDEAMGFFQAEIRNQVLEMFHDTEITIVNAHQQEDSNMGLFGLFGKKESKNVTKPANDTERWFTATYALWSMWAWTHGDWRYFAGVKETNKEKEESLRTVLSRDWGITDRESLLNMVTKLTSFYSMGTNREEEGIPAAWDLCRACQILGMGYVGGRIERKEMVKKSIEVGQIMQQYYHSWEELYDSYMRGYREWRKRQGGDVQKDIAEREALYSQLWREPDGPCSIKWDLMLR